MDFLNCIPNANELTLELYVDESFRRLWTKAFTQIIKFLFKASCKNFCSPHNSVTQQLLQTCAFHFIFIIHFRSILFTNPKVKENTAQHNNYLTHFFIFNFSTPTTTTTTAAHPLPNWGLCICHWTHSHIISDFSTFKWIAHLTEWPTTTTSTLLSTCFRFHVLQRHFTRFTYHFTGTFSSWFHTARWQPTTKLSFSAHFVHAGAAM